MAKKRRKRKTSAKSARRILFLCTGSIVLIVALCFALGSCWAEIISKYQEKKDLEKELVELKDAEDKLKADVKKMQDPDYIARYAREKYLYSKDGEYVIQLPSDKKAKTKEDK